MKIHHALLVFPLLLASCNKHHGSNHVIPAGWFSLDATDAPFTHDLVAHAIIQIDHVSIAEQVGQTSDSVIIYTDFQGAPCEFDLVQLRDGVTQNLFRRGLPSKTWREIRVHISKAVIELVNGDVFSTEDGTLVLDAQDVHGFPVALDEPAETPPGSDTVEILDFDLARSFIPEPAGDPLAATSYRLSPSLRVVRASTTGTVHGMVTKSDGNGGFLPVGS